jgi:hypothetical protein
VKNISKITHEMPKTIIRLVKTAAVLNDFASDLIIDCPESTFFTQIEAYRFQPEEQVEHSRKLVPKQLLQVGLHGTH